jgi:hypothetical protein
MHGYGSLSLFSIVWVFVWILWIFLLIRIINDVLRSADLTGNAKAGWTLALIVFPFAGALVYLISRGSDMHTRESQHLEANKNVVRHYIEQATSGSGTSSADEIAKLSGLRERGILTDIEFTDAKARVLDLQSAPR